MDILRTIDVDGDRTMTTATGCLLCGQGGLFGLPVCPDCGVTSPRVADTLVFVKPDPVHADRIRIARELEDILAGHAHTEQRKLVAAGHQALIRVPGNTAGRVLAFLAGHGIPAVGRAARNVWASVPAPFYALVVGVVTIGMAAGLASVPLLLLTSPLLAILMLCAAQLRLRQPAIDAPRRRPTFTSEVERAVVTTLTSLPEGDARALLADLVQAAHSLAGGPQADAVEQIVQLACRAAEDLSDLEIGLLHSGGQPGTRRSVQLHQALTDRLQTAVGVLHRLRAETIGLDPTRALLDELIEEFELEADAFLEARREVASALE